MLSKLNSYGGRRTNFMRRGIIPWDPFRNMPRIWDEEFFMEDFMPAIDVRQDKDNVIVKMEVPGIDPEKIDISVENDVLTVSGSREEKEEVKKEDYYRKEIRSGSFNRSVILPMQVKGDQADAQYKDGMLKIVLPKAEEVKPKKIQIKAVK